MLLIGNVVGLGLFWIRDSFILSVCLGFQFLIGDATCSVSACGHSDILKADTINYLFCSCTFGHY